MRTDRLLGLLGFVLAIVGAVLLLRSGLGLELSLNSLLRDLVPLVLGLVAVVGAFFLATRRYREGGLVCILIGIVALLVADQAAGILTLLGGVLGLVAEAT